ncbi:MAG: hypothetical protein NVSMB46_05070 [Candidatus Saccharimonadales bacterium]
MAHVLVIDDDVLIRNSLGELLKNEQHEVMTAENGKEGFELALDNKPDLIITDVRMPIMSGMDMVDALRNDTWGKTVPIIVLTNDETTDSINDALQSGVTVYLSKTTVDPTALAEQIKLALS